MREIKKIFLGAIIIFLILLFISIYLLIEEKTPNQKENKIVTKVIDGDTIIIEGGENVRLVGVDCDEKGKECYVHAKEYLEKNLLNNEVTLEAENEDKDIYGRKLRYIFLKGENMNLKIVKEGFCVARFQGESKYKKEIQDAEQFAIKNKIGCKWS